ncbi:hypothetical protein [Flavobacterium adhaerens]|uniref:hypothetical protein n=1 Tax=Flavobacterium adhaerens TaxID=3149043 RepID=UPI0032B36FFC
MKSLFLVRSITVIGFIFEKKEPMLALSLQATNLQEVFENSHRVEIMSVTRTDTSCLALLNVWKTDKYASIEQEIVCFDGIEIVDILAGITEKETRWQCIYGLENKKFWIGSTYKDYTNPAKLFLFEKEKLIKSLFFDKGYSTEIINIEPSLDESLLIVGNWYELVKSGSHDDFWPQRWETKITKEGEDYIENERPSIYRNYLPDIISDPTSNTFYAIENYGVSKYTSDEKLLWNQGLGHVQQEGLMPINKMALFYRTQNGEIFSDGVWFSGMDHTIIDRSARNPFFGRVTAGGTILSFTHLLNDFPEIHKIHKIISGKDNNCLLIGETLHIGRGKSMFLLYIQYSNGAFAKQIKYLNFCTNDLQLSIGDFPWFEGHYLEVKQIYPNSSHLEDLKEIIIFGNVSHLKNRDKGMVWSVKMKRKLI